MRISFLVFKTICFQSISNSFQMPVHQRKFKFTGTDHWWSIQLSSYGNLSHAYKQYALCVQYKISQFIAEIETDEAKIIAC